MLRTAEVCVAELLHRKLYEEIRNKENEENSKLVSLSKVLTNRKILSEKTFIGK